MSDLDRTQPYEPSGTAPTPPPDAPQGPAGDAVPAPQVPVGDSPTEPVPSLAAEAAAAAPAAAAPAATPVAATATEPVAAGATPRRSRLRWIVAGAATLLVAGTVVGATLLLTGESGDADVLAWTPADRVTYAELRLDLPGDQQAELAEILSAFPGFDDQAAFPQKISEVLDELVGQISDGTYDFTNDIDPWFGGAVSVSAGPPSTDPQLVDSSALVLVGVDDADAALAWVKEVLTAGGATITTESYAGVTISIVETTLPSLDGVEGLDQLPVDMELPKIGYAIVGPTLAIGDVASIKASIDTGGTKGLPTNAQFKEAEASVTDDRIAFLYTDTAASMAGAGAIPGELDPDGTLQALLDVVNELTPPWTAAAVHAKDGTLVVDSRMPHVDAFGDPAARESAIAGLVPADTFFLTTGHDIGTSIAVVKDLLAAEPALADAVAQVEQALALVGGFESATGWIGDLGVAVEPDGTGVVGGIVITPTDPGEAKDLLTTISAGLALLGDDIQVRTESYGGTEITIVDLGSIADLAGTATGEELPLPEGRAEVAFAMTDQVVVIGFGSSFVRDVLDARDGPSLAENERFTGLLAKVDEKHSALFFTDITAIRSTVEAGLESALPGDYDVEVRPYLEPFDAVIGTSVPGSELDTGTFVITFKQ